MWHGKSLNERVLPVLLDNITYPYCEGLGRRWAAPVGASWR